MRDSPIVPVPTLRPEPAATWTPPAAEPPEGSTSYYCLLFLPREKRDGLHRLYALLRALRDLADGEQVAGLAALERPVGLALPEGAPSPADPIRDLQEGARRDLEGRRYETWDELLDYCRLTGSAAGRLAVEILGYRDADSSRYAAQLGLAVRLTRLLRDVGTDAARGRIYLPREDCSRCGVEEAGLRADRPTPAFRELMSLQCARARRLYFRAEAALPRQDRMSLFPLEILSKLSYRLLERIERSDFDVLGRQVRLAGPSKAMTAFGVWLKYRLLGG